MTHSRDTLTLPAAEDLLPWHAQDISINAGPGWWSFNPSIHYDPADERWRCVFRCANYSLPGGVPTLSPTARLGRAASRCVLAELDPGELRVERLREMAELDDLPRAPACGSLGLEDMRLFRTARDGLMGVACALQYNLERPGCPEIVLCWIDDAGDVVHVLPLRGAWSAVPQKNWAPYDGTDEPRLIYSIERGVVMSDTGPLIGSPTIPAVRPTIVANNIGRSGVEVRMLGPTRAAQAAPLAQAPPPGSSELRGGSQLIEIAPGQWLGIAHETKLRQPERRKFYWHTFYLVDASGRVLGRSPPLKLSSQHGIEFAAGIAIDRRGTLAVSFGVDDHQSRIGITELGAVLGLLRPADEQRTPDPADHAEATSPVGNPVSDPARYRGAPYADRGNTRAGTGVLGSGYRGRVS
jgi:hypothetical protein